MNLRHRMEATDWKPLEPGRSRPSNRRRFETRLHGDPATIARAFHAAGERQHPARELPADRGGDAG